MQFHQWFTDAQQCTSIAAPEAATFSTARLPSGRISSRVVLCKEFGKDGSFVVYSNWGPSKKSKDIESNPHAALSFFWPELERQVRIEGVTEFLTNEESQIYFDTRARESRIGAWASPQSVAVKDRQELENKLKEIEKRFENQDRIPCPPFWGGLRIKPLEWEFWQGRRNRVHDRFTFTRDSVEDKDWKVQRLGS